MRAGAVGVVSVLSPAAIVTPSVACLLGGVSFKSAYARFVSLLSNEDAAEFITYHQTVSTARCYVLLGMSLRMSV